MATALARSAGRGQPGAGNAADAQRQDELVDGWRRYLAVLGARAAPRGLDRGPALGGGELLGLLDRLTLAAVVPVLVVATARPELTERAGFRPGGDRFFIELAGLDAATPWRSPVTPGQPSSPAGAGRGQPALHHRAGARSRARRGHGAAQPAGGDRAARRAVAARDRELLQRTAVVGERFTTADAALLTGRDGTEAAWRWTS